MGWTLKHLVTKAVFCLLAASSAFAGSELRVTEAEGKKAAIEKPAPAYPMVARQLKIAGRVEVEAIVSTTGSVEDVNAISGNPILTKPAMEAVKKWRFKPFETDGKAVRASVSLSFEFGVR
jgi:TonB family protein